MGAEMLTNISDAQAKSAVLEALTRHRPAIEAAILEFRSRHRGDVVGRGGDDASVMVFVQAMIGVTLRRIFPAVAAVAGPKIDYDVVVEKLIPIIGFGMGVTVEQDNSFTPVPELFEFIVSPAADSLRGLSQGICTRSHMAVLLMRYFSGNGDYSMIARAGIALAVLTRIKFMLDNKPITAGVS